ncbi:MAG: S8 family serine peptidase [Planctomycetes bacterium]|nr:S8 family serine peptidase [Planctomycetota bacterium]
MMIRRGSFSAFIVSAALLLSGTCFTPPSSAETLLSPVGAPGEFQFEAPAVSSNPGTFTGININTFLGANTFYGAGFTGQNTIVTNVEAGHIWGNTAAAGGSSGGHEALAHVTNFTHDASAWNYVGTPGDQVTDLVDQHATKVGLLIGGRNTVSSPGDHQLGIAYNTDLRSAAMATSWVSSLTFNASIPSIVTAYNQAFSVSDVVNSSIGTTDATGTGVFALVVDALAHQNSLTTMVAAAGNAGPSSNTVGAPGSGYNSITVAALNNDGNAYTSVASFSSRGPQSWDDNVAGGAVLNARAPVDIAAPGASLTSAQYSGATGGNNPSIGGSGVGVPTAYAGGLNGTSFASPIVAGGAALIDSASKNTPSTASNANSRDARVVKAVLLNSADKTSGWNNGQVANGNGGVTTTQALDYAVGTGRMNLDVAYDQYFAGTKDVTGTGSGNLGSVQAIGWDFGLATNGSTNEYYFNQALVGGSMLTVTLDWFRTRPIISGNVVDDSQANLNLRIFDATGGNVGTIISSSISTYNVVEHLHFALPYTGLFGIQVVHAGNLFDDLSVPEFGATVNYGLAWSGVAAEVAVPEPSTLALAAIGLTLALVALRVKRTRELTEY